MFWLVLGMTLAVALAVFVVGIVAVPARRAGRSMFTERGERLFRLSGDASPGPGRDAAKRGAGDRAANKAEKSAQKGAGVKAGSERAERRER